jgi:hypothetical protein
VAALFLPFCFLPSFWYRWASTHSPYQPFMAGYFVRLLMAVLLTTLAKAFPPGVRVLAQQVHNLPASKCCAVLCCAYCPCCKDDMNIILSLSRRGMFTSARQASLTSHAALHMCALCWAVVQVPHPSWSTRPGLACCQQLGLSPPSAAPSCSQHLGHSSTASATQVRGTQHP